MKKILCLDLGTKTGWAGTFSTMIMSGTIEFKNDRFQGGGMRFVKFRNWINQLYDSSPFEEVYFEEVRQVHKSVAAAHIYGGFMATLTSWCEEKNVPYEGIPVGTIKKFITGKGNANKQEVIDAVISKGYHRCDDNQADALALLLMKLEE